MVSTELLASVDALSEHERLALLAYIESTLGADSMPTREQQATAGSRLEALRDESGLGLTREEAAQFEAPRQSEVYIPPTTARGGRHSPPSMGPPSGTPPSMRDAGGAVDEVEANVMAALGRGFPA